MIDTDCRICGKPCYSYPCRGCGYNGEELEQPIGIALEDAVQVKKDVYQVKVQLFGETSAVKTCPVCFNNPETSKIFTEHDIGIALHGAKYRSIIDENQLIELLKYLKVDHD